MDQTQNWMWSNKRKQDDLTSTRGCDSWEEQAFAEDAAAGALGGCIWPPRSYSCTFCKREFRSAQALGGHMNVHRRDRARLKQSQTPQTQTSPHNNTTTNNNSILLHPPPLLDTQSQHQTCNFMFNHNNLDFDHRFDATTSSPIRVSSAPRLGSKNETQYLFPYVQEQSSTILPRMSSFYSKNQSQFLRNSNLLSSRATEEDIVKADVSISENPKPDLEWTTTSSRPNNKRGIMKKADLSISLNLVICRNNYPSRDSDAVEDGRCKKRRLDPAADLNLFNYEEASHDITRNDEQIIRTMNGLVSSIDSVDLELRLGDPPKGLSKLT